MLLKPGHISVIFLFFLIRIVGGGIQCPLGTAATNTPIVPAPRDYDDGEIDGMIGRGNRSTRRKPAPVPLCPPQTPHAVSVIQCVSRMRKRPFKGASGATFLRHYRALRR
jgi:hypothetical protein